MRITEPLAPKKHLDNEAGLKQLSYWDQFDAIVADKACPDPLTAVTFVLGLLTTVVNLSIVYLLVTYGQFNPEQTQATVNVITIDHEIVSKTLIAWCSLAAFLGMDGMYVNPILGYSPVFRSWQIGTIKEPFFCGRTGVWGTYLGFPALPFKRNVIDGPLLSLAYTLSRVWVAMSAVPSPAAASWYLFTTLLLLVFNFSSFIGASGMYHLPFAVYLYLKYTNNVMNTTDTDTDIDNLGDPALSVLQLTLVLLYIGCGCGKMGPWFIQVFIQEWTLPLWGQFINFKPLLYKNEMPKDNTPSILAKVLGYGAASTEWFAGILLCLPHSLIATSTLTSVLESYTHTTLASLDGYHDTTICSLPVAVGISVIIAMHLYIIVHLPTADVWILNLLPAYLVYYAFYIAPTVESGFDYAGFANLPPVWQSLCYAFSLFLVFGQFNTDKVSYTLCYRFWAGNWPHSYFFISKSGVAKMKKTFAKQWEAEEPGVIALLASNKWLSQQLPYICLGVYFTGQLNHRVLPRIIHKVTNGNSLTDYHDEGNRIYVGFILVQWLMGLTGNCSIRAFHALAVLQELCEFETGECQLINVNSFGSHQGYSGKNTTEWTILDANGTVESGKCSINECLSYTCPSASKRKHD